MRKNWMKGVVMGGAGILLLLLALFIIPHLVPTSSYRNFIAHELEERLAGKATVGALSLQLLPAPVVTIRDLGIATKDFPSGESQVVHVETMRGTISLGDLLFRKKITTSLTLEGLDIRWHITADGGSTIDHLVKNTASATTNMWSFDIRSLSVLSGSITMNRDGEGEPLVIEQITMKAPDLLHLFRKGSPLQINGIIKGGDPRNISMAGYLAVDPQGQKVSLREWNAIVGEMKLRFDGFIGYGKVPRPFSMHLATPDMNRTELGLLIPRLIAKIPTDLSWTGPIGTDLTLEREDHGFVVHLQSDAGQASVQLGRLMAKGNGMPLKISSTFHVSPETITIDTAKVQLGQSSFDLQGTVARTPPHTMRLAWSSTTFDITSIKTLIPELMVIGELVEPSLSITMEGPPILTATTTAPQMLAITGRLSGKKATVFDTVLDDPIIEFKNEGATLSLQKISGRLSGAPLSGTGTIVFGDIPEYHFDLTLEKLESHMIQLLGGKLTGEAGVSIKLATKGNEAQVLASNLTLEGTVSLPAGEITELPIGTQLFDEPTWIALQELTKTPIADTTKTTFKAINAAVHDLQATYQFAEKRLTVPTITFSNPSYKAAFSFSLDAQGIADGSGTITLTKELTAQLLGDPIRAKQLFADAGGSLSIPISIKGQLAKLIIVPDVSLLKTMLGKKLEEEKARIVIPKPAKPKTAPTPQSLPNAPPPPVKKKPKPEPPPPPQSQPMSEDDADNAMKVIIGK